MGTRKPRGAAERLPLDFVQPRQPKRHEDIRNDADLTLRLVNNTPEVHWGAAQALTKLHHDGQLDDDGMRDLVRALGLDALRGEKPAAHGDVATSDIRCPDCNASPGYRCTSANGIPVSFHRSRVRKASELRNGWRTT